MFPNQKSNHPLLATARIHPTRPPHFSHLPSTPSTFPTSTPSPTPASTIPPSGFDIPLLNHIPDIIAPVGAADCLDEIEEQQSAEEGAEDDARDAPAGDAAAGGCVGGGLAVEVGDEVPVSGDRGNEL